MASARWYPTEAATLCFLLNFFIMKKILFGTKEWADKTLNLLSGCKNNCDYCYARDLATRFHRKTAEDWRVEVLNKTAFAKRFAKRGGTIMFPSTHDITQDHLVECLDYLKRMLAAENRVLLVTKPDLVCVKAMCDELTAYRDQILFRFTVGSISDETLKFWEPGAPSYETRKAAILYAFNAGYSTSLSCEPMLDTRVDLVVEDLRPFITESIWIGKMNRLRSRLSNNGFKHDEVKQRAADQLLEWQRDENLRWLVEKYIDDPLIRWKESMHALVAVVRSEHEMSNV